MKVLRLSLASIVALSLLGACAKTETQTPPTPVQGTPAVTATASPSPAATATPEAAATPEATATPEEQAAVETQPTPTISVAPGIKVTGNIQVETVTREEAEGAMDPAFKKMVDKQR